jgi:hypothetical protein
MAHPFQTVVYVQIRRRWMSVRVMSWAGGDNRWEGEPRFLAFRDAKGREQLVPIETFTGDGVPPSREVCLFAHSRVAIDQISDTIVGTKVLLKRAKLKKAPAKPVIVFHLREHWAGGLTDVERNAFITVGKACGGGRILISEEPNELPAPEVLSLVKAARMP